MPGGSQAWWLLQRGSERIVAVAPSEDAAGSLFDDYQALERWDRPGRPSRAAFFSDDETDQVVALSQWLRGEVSVVFLSKDLFSLSLPEPESFVRAHRTLRWGEKASRDDFFAHVMTQGYERVDTVERVGEVAVRGEVMDLWSPGWEEPRRILWPFDTVESLRKLDLTSQRSSDAVPEILVLPASLTGKSSSWADHGDSVLFESHLSGCLPPVWPGRRVVHDPLSSEDSDAPFSPPPPFAGNLDLLTRHVRKWVDEGWSVVLFCHNPGEQERVEEILLARDRSLAQAFESRRIDLPLGPLTRGFLDHAARRVVLANGELFGRVRRRLRLPTFSGGTSLAGVADLRKGDYVVHEQFGIARFVGMDRKTAGGMEADYLRLEYRGGDRVFVPLFSFRQVRKFIGTEGKRPVLSSLDTHTWDRTRADVEAAVARLARDLLEQAARRAQSAGFAFPEDSHWEREFGASFLYPLTPDQARAIEDTRRDMMSPRPMDRLVCGDVGYGKTEVAMRAAFKAVCAGKQVGVLVPTTILAEQHGRNFKERFADYPVRIAVLSRFSKPSDLKTSLNNITSGAVDVVIGTHRLLSPDVAFKDLGLVIIDEEHRFGVKQKEKIKAFRDVVDVLALSATPIPRTLGQALGGLRGLSVIETPPEGRLPIGTHVGPFDPKIALAAVEQELRRGGQIFYVHNRVKSIEQRRRWLEETMRDHGLEARITLAHGQMSGPELERVMWDFHHRKFDVLLATSIIESGLDIPSVNTLVVEEAEDFGLAQLYQLRGRVGRERLKAYCYLFHSGEDPLTEDSQKRLSALKEFASLGSGFKLAMRDLEIRGAGNLLGPQQHGYVNAVGLDLYGQLLTEEIQKQQSGPPAESSAVRTVDPSIELPVSAYLPEDYLPSESDRVLFYKRLLEATDPTLDSLAAEIEDRCGRMPDPARQLFDVARLRMLARKRGVTRVELVDKGLELRFVEGIVFEQDHLTRLPGRFNGRFSFLPGPPFGMRWEGPFASDIVLEAIRLIERLDGLEKDQ